MSNSTDLPIPRRVRNLTGKRYGKLTVVRYAGTTPDRERALWECRCDCGTVKVISEPRQRGSCGCLVLEKVRTRGRSYSAEYRAWQSLKDRCLNENAQAYEQYGARGRRVCRRWTDSFEAFLEDMGERPSKKHSIDRIDNSKGYTCGKCEDCQRHGDAANCRWATAVEQNRNRGNNRILTWDGKTLSLKEWSEITGLPMHILSNRWRRGHRTGETLFRPRGPYSRKS